jgi:hypothetical protein
MQLMYLNGSLKAMEKEKQPSEELEAVNRLSPVNPEAA